MNFQKVIVPVVGVLLVAAAYSRFGWPGVALVVGGLVMWVLMNFTRMMKVLERAGQRPVGYVDSAVMLNAKLRPRMSLLHVIAMTRALGKAMTAEGEQPEIFRWTDTTDSYVTAEFKDGKLVKWELQRPAVPADPPVADAPVPAAPPAP